MLKRLVRSGFRSVGLDVVRYRPRRSDASLPPDICDEDRSILKRIADFSLTSVERQASLVQACRYLGRRGIEGCFVECGVWRGGSSMAAALTFAEERDTNRHLFLFDTYEGMTPPTAADKTADGTLAQVLLDRDVNRKDTWCVAGLEDVQQNMASTRYPEDRIHYIKGPVEKTIPAQFSGGPIALLRLDTDWYESTKHELVHLFPLLVEGGVLIIDDYGHWSGAKKAVDEYFLGLSRQFFLHRVDYTGRLLIKN